MICVPIGGDQNLVAYRVCDELGLGLRADIRKDTYREIRRAVHRVLGDQSFYERTKRFSNISHSHDGAKTAAKCIMKNML